MPTMALYNASRVASGKSSKGTQMSLPGERAKVFPALVVLREFGAGIGVRTYPINFRRFGIDPKRSFLADREPLLECHLAGIPALLRLRHVGVVHFRLLACHDRVSFFYI